MVVFVLMALVFAAVVAAAGVVIGTVALAIPRRHLADLLPDPAACSRSWRCRILLGGLALMVIAVVGASILGALFVGLGRAPGRGVVGGVPLGLIFGACWLVARLMRRPARRPGHPAPVEPSLTRTPVGCALPTASRVRTRPPRSSSVASSHARPINCKPDRQPLVGEPRRDAHRRQPGQRGAHRENIRQIHRQRIGCPRAQRNAPSGAVGSATTSTDANAPRVVVADERCGPAGP